MTDYTDLKAMLRSSTKGLRLDSEFRLRSHEKITPFGVQEILHIADLLADSLAAIEELEQRIQSMGGSSDAATEAMPKATSRGADPCEPPAPSSAAPAPEPVALANARFPESYANAAPQPAQADEARELLREVVDHVFGCGSAVKRIRAFLKDRT